MLRNVGPVCINGATRLVEMASNGQLAHHAGIDLFHGAAARGRNSPTYQLLSGLPAGFDPRSQRLSLIRGFDYAGLSLRVPDGPYVPAGNINVGPAQLGAHLFRHVMVYVNQPPAGAIAGGAPAIEVDAPALPQVELPAALPVEMDQAAPAFEAAFMPADAAVQADAALPQAAGGIGIDVQAPMPGAAVPDIQVVLDWLQGAAGKSLDTQALLRAVAGRTGQRHGSTGVLPGWLRIILWCVIACLLLPVSQLTKQLELPQISALLELP